MEKELISVDRWAEGSEAYFLTHLHSDHTTGLSAMLFHAPLFCSPITAKLFRFRFPDFDLSLLRILHPNTTHTLSLPSIALHVTAIDACHCPGSIMLLFRGPFGSMLYTGDFRWEPRCQKATTAKRVLTDALGDAPGIHVLYLDNTYCNPVYDFPVRSVAAKQVIDIITSHPDHDVIIGINTLGKEDLLVEIACALQIKIWVLPERLRTMHILGYHDIFTTDTSLTRVRAYPQYGFSIETLEALNEIVGPTIGILPSGLPWIKKSHQKESELLSGSFLTRNKRGKEAPIGKHIENIGSPEKIHKYIYSVPYSDHSNFEEIADFIKLVQPATLKGIVSSSSCYVEPSYYFGRLCGVDESKDSKLNLLNRYKRRKVAGAFSSKTSIGRNNKVKYDGGRGKNLKLRFAGFRVNSRFSVLRRKQRGAKIQESSSSDQLTSLEDDEWA